MTVPLQNPPTLACAGALSRSTLPGAWLKASVHAGSHHVASQPGIASSRTACALSTVLVAIHTWTALSIHGLKARPDTVMIASEPLAGSRAGPELKQALSVRRGRLRDCAGVRRERGPAQRLPGDRHSAGERLPVLLLHQRQPVQLMSAADLGAPAGLAFCYGPLQLSRSYNHEPLTGRHQCKPCSCEQRCKLAEQAQHIPIRISLLAVQSCQSLACLWPSISDCQSTGSRCA